MSGRQSGMAVLVLLFMMIVFIGCENFPEKMNDLVIWKNVCLLFQNFIRFVDGFRRFSLKLFPVFFLLPLFSLSFHMKTNFLLKVLKQFNQQKKLSLSSILLRRQPYIHAFAGGKERNLYKNKISFSAGKRIHFSRCRTHRLLSHSTWFRTDKIDLSNWRWTNRNVVKRT